MNCYVCGCTIVVEVYCFFETPDANHAPKPICSAECNSIRLDGLAEMAKHPTPEFTKYVQGLLSAACVQE